MASAHWYMSAHIMAKGDSWECAFSLSLFSRCRRCWSRLPLSAIKINCFVYAKISRGRNEAKRANLRKCPRCLPYTYTLARSGATTTINLLRPRSKKMLRQNFLMLKFAITRALVTNYPFFRTDSFLSTCHWWCWAGGGVCWIALAHGEEAGEEEDSATKPLGKMKKESTY